MKTLPVFVYGLLYNACHMFNGVDRSSGSIPIQIKDSGIKEMKKQDVAMAFYITVTNTGNETIQLFVNSTKCCWTVTDHDQDCESMQLHGSGMVLLPTPDHWNLTLLFVNMYPYDRVGQCQIEIKDDGGKTMQHTIHFNTKLRWRASEDVPPLLKEYYEVKNVKQCKSVDEDPLAECKPFWCDIRYNGKRTYFNHSSRRCEKLPEGVEQQVTLVVSECEQTLEILKSIVLKTAIYSGTILLCASVTPFFFGFSRKGIEKNSWATQFQKEFYPRITKGSVFALLQRVGKSGICMPSKMAIVILCVFIAAGTEMHKILDLCH